MDKTDTQGVVPGGALPTRGETRLRVRYCECDPGGVAHHSAYAPWLEIGRTEALRESGVTYAQIERAGVFLVITKLDIRFLAPARYDDVVIVRTSVAGGKRARLDHEYELFCETAGGADGQRLASASTTLACVDGEGRPRPLPEWLTADAHGA